MLEFFKMLEEQLKNHEKIVFMTHKRPDLDGMGSALAFYKIVKLMNKEACIVAPKEMVNKSLNKALKLLADDGMILPFKYEKNIIGSKDEKSLLIVLDTQKPELVESAKMLENFEDIIVIDHHSPCMSKIKSTVCEFCDSTKSSVIEIMTEFLIYQGIKLDRTMLTMMLAGLEVDTNGFNLKMTARTFEIAAYLTKEGADFVLKQKILKESREEMIKRYEYIKNSVKILPHAFLCVMDDKIHGNVELALLAKEILKFEDVEVAFAVGYLASDIIGISARSMGNIDVGRLMNKLGGGGHQADAATQIKNKTIDEVVNLLIDALREERYESDITK